MRRVRGNYHYMLSNCNFVYIDHKIAVDVDRLEFAYQFKKLDN